MAETLSARTAPTAPAPGPPGLGGLLMVVGGALCVAGGIFIAFGAEALVTISPRAATAFLKGTPLVAGGALVLVGASVRRALGRAYAQGMLAGRDRGAPPDGARWHHLPPGHDGEDSGSVARRTPPDGGA